MSIQTRQARASQEYVSHSHGFDKKTHGGQCISIAFSYSNRAPLISNRKKDHKSRRVQEALNGHLIIIEVLQW